MFVWQWQCSDETLIHPIYHRNVVVRFQSWVVHNCIRFCITSILQISLCHLVVRAISCIWLLFVYEHILKAERWEPLPIALKLKQWFLLVEKNGISHLYILCEWIWMAEGRMQIICYLGTDCTKWGIVFRNKRGLAQQAEGQKPLHNRYACLLFHLWMFLLSNLWITTMAYKKISQNKTPYQESRFE